MGAQEKGSLDTFGGFALSFEGLCLRDDENRSKKVWNLLSYLILNRERDLGVAELYQMLWQDKDEENPYGALKNTDIPCAPPVRRSRVSGSSYGSQQ